MTITIQQIANSAPKEYRIEIDGQTRYYAYVRFRKRHTFIDLVTVRGVRPIVSLEIKKEVRSFKLPTYYILGLGEKAIACKPGPRRENRYQLVYEKDTYDIIGHRNSFASIFKNEQQIWLLANQTIVTFLQGYKYSLEIDFDCDLRIALSLALIWDNFSFNSEGIFPQLIFNIGQLWEIRKRDVHWRARSE